MDMKICALCEVEKPLNDYSKYRNKCKECMKQIKRDYNNNHKQDQHIYYIENKDKIIKRNKEWDIKVKCECGVEIHKKHKSEHLKTRKHLDFINGVVKEYKESCPCGGGYNSKSSYYKHIKTKNHIEFIETNKDNVDLMKRVRNEFLTVNECLLEGQIKKTTNKKLEDNSVTIYYNNENGTKKILKLTKEQHKVFRDKQAIMKTCNFIVLKEIQFI